MIIETMGLAVVVANNKNKGGKFNIAKNQEELFNRQRRETNTSAVVTKHYVGTFMNKR